MKYKTDSPIVLAAPDHFSTDGMMAAIEGEFGIVPEFTKDPIEVSYFFNQENPPKILIISGRLDHDIELSEDETNNGRRTGSVIYEELRKQYPNLSVIIFTNDENEVTNLNLHGDSKLVVITWSPQIEGDIVSAIKALVPELERAA